MVYKTKFDIDKEVEKFLKWKNDPKWAHEDFDFEYYIRNLLNRQKDSNKEHGDVS